MANISSASGHPGETKVSWYYNPEIRGWIYQVVTILALIGIGYEVWSNALANMAKSNMTFGFEFLNGRAGFDLGQSLIAYSSDSTYIDALWVGILNSLLVAGFGIVTASLLGLLIGVGQMSRNWIISRLCTVMSNCSAICHRFW
jgi:general L-amino acid transport system permease protein